MKTLRGNGVEEMMEDARRRIGVRPHPRPLPGETRHPGSNHMALLTRRLLMDSGIVVIFGVKVGEGCGTG